MTRSAARAWATGPPHASSHRTARRGRRAGRPPAGPGVLHHLSSWVARAPAAGPGAASTVTAAAACQWPGVTVCGTVTRDSPTILT